MKSVLNTNGAAGPSGMDANGWRRICSSFHCASDALCDALALCARRIATTAIDPSSLEAYTACRLIPLDKQPGVRPIGIGEVVRRVIGKAILMVVGPAIQQATGCLQLCAGQQSGIEAAIHAMRSAFAQDDTEAVLLADASNAFNRINRNVCIRNIQHLCPEFSTTIVNTYRSPSRLFVGGETILSCEGTTQGDPLAMAMYALGTVPLIRRAASSKAVQAWFADDSTAASTLTRLHKWWSILEEEGPSYGYYINAKKSILLVKPECLDRAREIFQDSSIDIRSDGCRHLGAVLRSPTFCSAYVSGKVDEWCREVDVLAEFARTQPQAAFAAFGQGVRHQWSFVARTVPNTADLLAPLEERIRTKFIPAIINRVPPGDIERAMLALPCRDGGLGIVSPSSLASQFQDSMHITKSLVQKILQQDQSAEGVPAATITAKAEIVSQSRRLAKEAVASVIATSTSTTERTLNLAAEKGASSWLTCRPLRQYGFNLHKQAFWDALCLRYGWTPPGLPTECVCGKAFSPEHALSCPTGGYPAMRHNDLRDLTASLLREVAHDVQVEPHLQPLTGETFRHRSAISEDGARLDVAASGVWGGRFERALLDIRVFNPHARSNRQQSITATYRKHEAEKRRAYEERVREVEHASFSPIVFSASGGYGKSASAFFKRVASMLADKRKEPFSSLLAFIRSRVSFSLVRASNASLRGHRRPRSQDARQRVIDSDASVVLAAAECFR